MGNYIFRPERVENIVNQLDLYKKSVGEEGIDLNPPYQRGEPASPGVKKSIIKAVNSGTLVSPIVIRKNPDRPNVFEVLDGKQRLTAIKEHYEYLNKIANKSKEKNDKDLFRDFKTKTVWLVETGVLDDTTAHQYFVNCNKYTTPMTDAERLNVYYSNPIYKNICQYRDEFQKIVSIEKMRNLDIQYLLCILYSIKNKKNVPPKRAVKLFEEDLALIDPVDFDKTKEENDKILSTFISVTKKFMQENKVKKFGNLKGGFITQLFVSIAACVTGKTNSNEVHTFYKNNKELFPSSSLLDSEKKKEFNTTLSKHINSTKGGTTFQNDLYHFLVNNFLNITENPRVFSKELIETKQ